MMHVYLDNAATTAVDPEVLEAMMPFLAGDFGNPSSIHAHGSKIRAAIEQARRTVAGLLGAAPAEIFFTSGGTEADNTGLRGAVKTYGLKRAITSRLEHHAVLHTLEEMQKEGQIELLFVENDKQGRIIPESLQDLLKTGPKALVALMYANNEIGNVNDPKIFGPICAEYGAFYQSDFVQGAGHFPVNFSELQVHSAAVAAHKFHGPKGAGVLYMKADKAVSPFVTGGAQERNMRGGTENVPGIIGLAKALEISYRDLEKDHAHILSLKNRMADGLRAGFPDIQFNGLSADPAGSLYTVLNASFAPSDVAEMLLFSLDINKISVSGGSACSSGSGIGSHVLAGIGADPERASVRFSFSKYNTEAEIDYTIEKLKEILA